MPGDQHHPTRTYCSLQVHPCRKQELVDASLKRKEEQRRQELIDIKYDMGIGDPDNGGQTDQ